MAIINASGEDESAEQLSLLSGGKLLVAGARHNENVVVARLNADGSPDTSFGSRGILVTDLFRETALQMAVDPSSGKIAFVYRTEPGEDTTELAVLNADGSPDAGFDGDGLKTLNSILSAGIAWQGGRLLVGWNRFTPDFEDTEIVLTRLTTAGATDTTFGDAGTVTISDDVVREDNTRDQRALQQLRVDANGRIIIGSGYFRDSLSIAGDPRDFRGNVYRLTEDGRRDDTFGGGDGEADVFFRAAQNDAVVLRDVVLESNGDLRALWSKIDEDVYFVSRFGPDGVPDDAPDVSLAMRNRQIRQFIVDSAGRILVTGDILEPQGIRRTLFIRRFLPDGTADRSYGVVGEAQSRVLGISLPIVLLLPDGAAVVGGGTLHSHTNAFTLIRLQGGEGASFELELTNRRALKLKASDASNSIRVHRRGNGRIVVRIDDDARSFAPSSAKRIVIDAAGGNDRVTIESDLPRAFISGGHGNDTITGGDGNDVLNGGPGRNHIAGGAGDDEIRGAGRDDDLIGNDGNDTIHGGEGDDRLFGHAGEDNLFGGAGNDTSDDDPLDMRSDIEVLL